MLLNLGCGGHRAPAPWVNIDRSFGSRQFPAEPDIVADLRALPFADGSVEAVYAGHVLEHIPYDTVTAALAEFRRVLRPDGQLGIVGPDMDRATGDFADFAPCIWPGQPGPWATWEGAAHQYCPTASNTLVLVAEVFPGALEVPIATLADFWPATSREGWQFAIVSTPTPTRCSAA